MPLEPYSSSEPTNSKFSPFRVSRISCSSHWYLSLSLLTALVPPPCLQVCTAPLPDPFCCWHLELWVCLVSFCLAFQIGFLQYCFPFIELLFQILHHLLYFVDVFVFSTSSLFLPWFLSAHYCWVLPEVASGSGCLYCRISDFHEKLRHLVKLRHLDFSSFLGYCDAIYKSCSLSLMFLCLLNHSYLLVKVLAMFMWDLDVVDISVYFRK